MGVWQHQGDALHWGLRGGRASSCCTSPQFMQKKSPLYVLLKEDTVWSMEHLNRYINDKFHKTKGLPRDWVFTTFTVCVCPAHSARGGDGGQDWVGEKGQDCPDAAVDSESSSDPRTCCPGNAQS